MTRADRPAAHPGLARERAAHDNAATFLHNVAAADGVQADLVDVLIDHGTRFDEVRLIGRVWRPPAAVVTG